MPSRQLDEEAIFHIARGIADAINVQIGALCVIALFVIAVHRAAIAPDRLRGGHDDDPIRTPEHA